MTHERSNARDSSLIGRGGKRWLIRDARVSDARGIALVHVDTWRSTYAGIVALDNLDKLSYDEREQRWTRNLSDPECGRSRFTLVAEDEKDKIVGFASGGPERTNDRVYRGELWAIYVLA